MISLHIFFRVWGSLNVSFDFTSTHSSSCEDTLYNLRINSSLTIPETYTGMLSVKKKNKKLDVKLGPKYFFKIRNNL
jgi:hypothetical protein